MTLYAYYSENRKEPLDLHIITGLKQIELIYLKRGYHRYIKARLKALGYEYDETYVKKIMLMTYAYHDIGKATEKLQEMIMNGKGAPYHEVLSAIILKNQFDEQYITPLEKGCVIAVLLHMGALRDPIKSINKAISQGIIYTRLKGDTITWFNKTLKKIYPEIADIFLIKQSRDMTFNKKSVYELISFLGEYFYIKRGTEQRIVPIQLSTYLLLHPLITADELAVCKNTNKKPRKWIDEFIGAFKS